MDFDNFEEVAPRRALGSGHWDRRLKRRLTNLSNADVYNEANKEWIVTDNVWYIPFGDDANLVLPDVHAHGLNTHTHECLCGHPIVWHFEIENTENGNKQIVGSEHIESYMVIRYFEKKGYDPTTITEAMIDEWVQEKVKSLKAQWWWDLHGEQFEDWFTEIRELDLRVNVREKGTFNYNSQTRRNEPVMVIRKRAEGKFGVTGYQMASIVWRWNHPDNTRRQIESRGYPNERLWNDLQFFYIMQQQYRSQVAQEDRETNQRIAEIAELVKQQEIKREENRKLQEEGNAARRIEKHKQMIRDAELEGVREKKRLERIIADRINIEQYNEKFIEMCEYYDIPTFTVNVSSNDWERRFLSDLIYKLSRGKSLSEAQLQHLRKIVVDEPLPATEKQKWYIKRLAGDDFVISEDLNRTDASELISRLKGEEE